MRKQIKIPFTAPIAEFYYFLETVINYFLVKAFEFFRYFFWFLDGSVRSIKLTKVTF